MQKYEKSAHHLLIKDVFCSDFCNQFIHHFPMQEAIVNVYGQEKKLPDIRNNFRTFFENSQLSYQLDLKIKSLIHELLEPSYECPDNEFKLYLYEVGQYFKPHKDGSIKKYDKKTQLTCLIYLNECQGGETVLMPDGIMQKNSYITITPHTGDILIFRHKTWHEGKTVLAGEKWVLRANLF